MMYTAITENDISQWDDEMGVQYHFPRQYQSFLKEGTQVVYYKGRMDDKSFLSKRLSSAPHYFGIGKIGKVTYDTKSKTFYAQILNFDKFTVAVPFKIEGKYIEEIPESKKGNYWRNGVRPISEAIYKRIVKLSTIDTDIKVYNDQTESEFETVIIEGGKKKVYTTVYERDKGLRNLALLKKGYTCEVCAMNFKDHYGSWGEGFIHVHHNKPLYQNPTPKEVDINKDLNILCPNCHAMVHRKKNKVLTVDELKDMIKVKK